MTTEAEPYEFTIRCSDAPVLGRRAPLINTYVERTDGQVLPVLVLLDTGAGISVFDGRIALAALHMDPRQSPIDVVPLSALAVERARPGYVHEVRCYFGGYVRFAALSLHVAFTDQGDTPLAFNVL